MRGICQRQMAYNLVDIGSERKGRSTGQLAALKGRNTVKVIEEDCDGQGRGVDVRDSIYKKGGNRAAGVME